MIILEIIGIIIIGVLFFGLLSTLLGQPLVYKRLSDKPFVTPDFLPSILSLLLNFFISIPEQLFNSKDFKLKKLQTKKATLIKEIQNYEYQILSFEKMFENENNQWSEIRELKENLENNNEISVFERIKLQNEINQIEMQHLSKVSSFSNYSNRQEYDSIKEYLVNSKNELNIIENKLKNLS